MLKLLAQLSTDLEGNHTLQSITRDLQESSYAPAMNWFKDIMTQLHFLPTENAAEVIKQLIIQLHEQMLINQYQHDKTADSDSIYLIIIIFIQNSLEANDHIKNAISSSHNLVSISMICNHVVNDCTWWLVRFRSHFKQVHHLTPSYVPGIS
jgi:hypothetical protein